jgi:hypothetical protein
VLHFWYGSLDSLRLNPAQQIVLIRYFVYSRFSRAGWLVVGWLVGRVEDGNMGIHKRGTRFSSTYRVENILDGCWNVQLSLMSCKSQITNILVLQSLTNQ